MNKDIVCAESELSIAANNIVEYANFLSRTIETYIAVLGEIQDKGIQDDLVCSKLTHIAQSLSPYKVSINSVSEEIAKDVGDYISGVSKADKLNFPEDITSKITSIVTQFL